MSDSANEFGGPSVEDYDLAVAIDNTPGSETDGDSSGVSSRTSDGVLDAFPSEPLTGTTDAKTAASTCYHEGSHVWHQKYCGRFGVKVAWIEKDHNYRCGTGAGGTITDNGISGFYHKTWSNFPYCLASTSNQTDWADSNHGIAQSEITGQDGLLTPWFACASLSSQTAALRVHADGDDGYTDGF
jgi:hypothetical protein